MTVGETLTQARNHAGLSVDELSERTRIRGTVIRSIEQDDYGSLGGDPYVRGYVRAIAGAVGIDAQPLIREYDLGRTDERTGSGADTTRFDLPAVREDPAATVFDLPAVPQLPAEAAPPVADDLMAAGYDLDVRQAAEPAAAGAAAAATSVLPPSGSGPAGPGGAGEPAAGPPAPGQPGPRRRDRGRGLGVAAVAVIVAVALVVLGIRLASGSGTPRSSAASSAPSSAARASAGAAAQAAAAARASAGTSGSAAASAVARATASAPAGAHGVVPLPVASATAFGPDGAADGDNPGSAGNAIASDPQLSWSTQWYRTARFGLLKHGTGLLLSLGRSATVTSVRLDLSSYRGATVQLRAGNGTDPQDLRVAATASNAGGVLRLALPHPVTAKYLLIWFTLLAPDGAGHYQESVSRVVVSGRR